MELSRSLEQARPIPLEAVGDVILPKKPTVDDVSHLFDALNLPLPPSLSPVRIIQKALNPRNPYQ
jgi:hypothetical protein